MKKRSNPSSLAIRLARLSELARSLLAEIAAARRARIAAHRAAVIERRRLQEKERMVAALIGSSMRITTGNHGRRKPRY